jgi:hypothetical protein
MDQEDDLGFIEMKSVLGESKTLLEFLIDCISIASETPEWAFMRVEGGTSQGAMNAQTIPFEKKIERKRIMFQEPIQMICKMVIAINGQTPERVELAWEEVRVESLVAMAQAIQQLVVSYDVLLERKLISDNTAREGLKTVQSFQKDEGTEGRGDRRREELCNSATDDDSTKSLRWKWKRQHKEHSAGQGMKRGRKRAIRVKKSVRRKRQGTPRRSNQVAAIRARGRVRRRKGR